MTRREFSYDSRCQDLAEIFLEDETNVTEHDKQDLAQTIQDAIEGWLSHRANAAEAQAPL